MTAYAGVTVDVLERLGLDPATDGPLICWQSLETIPGTTVPPTLSVVGGVAPAPGAGGAITAIPLPAGSAVGDLFTVTGSAGAGFGDHNVDLTDPRFIDTQTLEVWFGGPWPELHGTGYGVLTDLADVVVNVRSLDSNRHAALAVYRTAGTIGAVFSSGDVTNATSVPCIPTLAPGAFNVLALSSHADMTGALTSPGPWIEDASSNGARIWHSTAPAPAHVHNITGGDSNLWSALSVGITSGTTSDPVTGWVTDPALSHALISYQLAYGRTDPVSKVKPVQLTVTAAADLADPPDIGDLFRLAVCLPAALLLGLTEDEAARFTGEVTDVEIDVAHRTWAVIAVHTRARLGRRPIDLTRAGVVTDSERVTAVLSAIDAAAGIIDTDDILLAVPDAVTAGAALLEQVDDSTTGRTVDQLTGVTDWQGPDHRRGTHPVMVLDAAEILTAVTWSKHVGSVLNIATVNYPGGTVDVVDHASVETRGEYPVTLSTALTTDDDAASLGSLVVGRYSAPVWNLPTLTVDPVRSVSPGNLGPVLRLRHSDRVTLTDLPDAGPIAGDVDWFHEGFTDTAARWSWRMGLAVSDPRLSGVSLRWVDVDGFLTWAAVDPSTRWLDVAHMEDPDDLGTGSTSLDGGTAATAAFSRVIDGGTSSTLAYDHTIDGGAA